MTSALIEMQPLESSPMRNGNAGSLEEEARWRAVQSRDRSFDGRFVYAVRSTGIYCRPSCPARKPRRDRVAYFPLAEAAESAGFRACARCRPREVQARDPRLTLAGRACAHIERHLDEPLTLRDLGQSLGVSGFHLQRTFKSVLGITPREYLDARRLGALKSELARGRSVTTSLYEVGYGSPSRLYERASVQLGMTPGAYRRGGRGLAIGYDIVESPLGRLLVAATARGICAVSLGDSDAALERGLASEFPEAELRRGGAALSTWARELVRRARGLAPSRDLPLDVQATAFQWSVWRRLRAVPPGQTRSYGELARALGRPRAARAVARACATNPVALVIPCHRAIAADGGLSGYRWGRERKRTLLEGERRHAPRPRRRGA